MSLLGTRDYYKPFEHPWMFDYYSQQNQMHWFPEDVPLHNDVKDWQTMTAEEKNLLTQIFRLFTQSDVDVGAGYVDKFMPIFKRCIFDFLNIINVNFIIIFNVYKMFSIK